MLLLDNSVICGFIPVITSSGFAAHDTTGRSDRKRFAGEWRTMAECLEASDQEAA
jgi:hypothetical protein